MTPERRSMWFMVERTASLFKQNSMHERNFLKPRSFRKSQPVRA